MVMSNLESEKRDCEMEMDSLFGEFRARRNQIQKVVMEFQRHFEEYMKKVDEVEKR